MSTRDELLAAAEWASSDADRLSISTLSMPDGIVKHMCITASRNLLLAAAALREKASAVEGFDAWLKIFKSERNYDFYHIELCKEAYTAGHAAASERVAELERQVARSEREVSQFNDGYDAAQAGKCDTSPDYDEEEDQWLCGYAWGKYNELTRERTLLVAEVRRCWADEEREFFDACINTHRATYAEAAAAVEKLIVDRPAEVRTIVEAQP